MYTLGIRVKKLFDEGATGCMVSSKFKRRHRNPLYLKDFEDENGRVQPSLVDIESDMANLFISTS